jgi:anaerobic C4-dicarboxylate transporter
MVFGDRLMLSGMAAVAAIFGIAFLSLGGKRPHYAWLEKLARVKLGPRHRIALMIVLVILLAVMSMAAVDAFTKPQGFVK